MVLRLFLPLAILSTATFAESPALTEALKILERDNAWTLEQQQSICQVPAPPFKESERGIEYAKRLKALGLENVHADPEGNVIGTWPGSKSAKPLIVFSAHLDTVFPEGSDVTVKRDGGRMKGLGIGDDCRGLAVVLAVARAFQQTKIRFDGTVLFVATVGEEGQGDLRGVRYLFEKSEFKGKVDNFISVDGSGSRITSGGVGSYRYRVTYRGRGGHSYGSFGMPNPAHAMGRAIARIADIQVPKSPKTTFNVGTVTGGTSVNSVPIEVSMEVDLRSESPTELKALDERFKAALNAALEQEKARWPDSKAPIELDLKSIGIRPATEVSDTRPLTVAAMETAKQAGLTIFSSGAGSTDSNIPLALGIPSVTIGGGGIGTGAHSVDEAFEDRGDGYKGPQWAVLLIARLAGISQ